MSIFDGVTGLFEGVFDCAVTLLRDGAEGIPMRGVFREEPFLRTDTDGSEITVVQPVLKLRAAYAEQVKRGDLFQIEDRPGETFKAVYKDPTRSPAVDRYFLIVLTAVEAP